MSQEISRRTLLVGLAGTAVFVGCSSDGTDATANISSPASSTTASTDGATTVPTSLAPPTSLGDKLPGDPFTLGIASGDPDSSSVVLWTRLTVATSDKPVPVGWEVAEDEAFTKPVASGVTAADASVMFTVHVLAEKLPANQWFFYRFQAGGYVSEVGRTRTLPAAGTADTTFVLASASCQNFETGYYHAHKDIAAQEPDAVLFLGDYIYEYEARPVDEATGIVRSHLGPRLTTLDHYRVRYARYRSDPDLRAAHAACPWMVIWDDHEVENNYAGSVSAGQSTPEEFEAMRAAAYQAWWEHMPTRLPRPTPGEDYPIYRKVAIGDLATLFLVDGRQYRSDQVCGDRTLSLDPPCPEVFEPTRTMLGAEQESWLIDGLASTSSVWNVIGNQTILTDVTLNGAVLNFDQWDGYPAARKRLVDAIASSGKTNTVVVTGDIHLAGVGDVATDRLSAGGVVVATEFVTTSISSDGNLPEGSQDVLTAFETIKYAEDKRRGYILHTISPTAWTADYRVVDNVKATNATVTTDASFTMAPDKPGAVRKT